MVMLMGDWDGDGDGDNGRDERRLRGRGRIIGTLNWARRSSERRTGRGLYCTRCFRLAAIAGRSIFLRRPLKVVAHALPRCLTSTTAGAVLLATHTSPWSLSPTRRVARTSSAKLPTSTCSGQKLKGSLGSEECTYHSHFHLERGDQVSDETPATVRP